MNQYTRKDVEKYINADMIFSKPVPLTGILQALLSDMDKLRGALEFAQPLIKPLRIQAVENIVTEALQSTERWKI